MVDKDEHFNNIYKYNNPNLDNFHLDRSWSTVSALSHVNLNSYNYSSENIINKLNLKKASLRNKTNNLIELSKTTVESINQLKLINMELEQYSNLPFDKPVKTNITNNSTNNTDYANFELLKNNYNSSINKQNNFKKNDNLLENNLPDYVNLNNESLSNDNKASIENNLQKKLILQDKISLLMKSKNLKYHNLEKEFEERNFSLFENLNKSKTALNFSQNKLQYTNNPDLEYYNLKDKYVFIEDFFPGMYPSRSWPIDLDDLLIKLFECDIKTFFLRPFNIKNNDNENILKNGFFSEALSYIKSQFKSFLNCLENCFINTSNKNNLESITINEKLINKFNEFCLTEEYLIKAIQAVVNITLLMGNINVLNVIFTELTSILIFDDITIYDKLEQLSIYIDNNNNNNNKEEYEIISNDLKQYLSNYYKNNNNYSLNNNEFESILCGNKNSKLFILSNYLFKRAYFDNMLYRPSSSNTDKYKELNNNTINEKETKLENKRSIMSKNSKGSFIKYNNNKNNEEDEINILVDKINNTKDSSIIFTLFKLINYEKELIPVALMRNYSIYESYSISSNILYTNNNNGYYFHETSSTCTDGTYLYIALCGVNGGILKVGTGLNNTIKGKVYKELKDELFSQLFLFDMVIIKDKLIIKFNTNADKTQQLIKTAFSNKENTNNNNSYNSNSCNSKDTENTSKNNIIELLIINADDLAYFKTIKLILNSKSSNSIIKSKNEKSIILSDNNKLYLLILEAETENNKASNNNEEKIKDDNNDSIKNNNLLPYVSLVLYTFDVHDYIIDSENNNKENNNYYTIPSYSKLPRNNESKEQNELIIELYDNFSHIYSYKQCKKALIINSWEVEKAAVYLVENELEAKEDMLLAEDYIIISQSKLETLDDPNKTGRKEIVNAVMADDVSTRSLINNNNNNSNNIHINGINNMNLNSLFEEESLKKYMFDVTNFYKLKWIITEEKYLIGYKLDEGYSIICSTNHEDSKIVNINYISSVSNNINYNNKNKLGNNYYNNLNIYRKSNNSCSRLFVNDKTKDLKNNRFIKYNNNNNDYFSNKMVDYKVLSKLIKSEIDIFKKLENTSSNISNIISSVKNIEYFSGSNYFLNSVHNNKTKLIVSSTSKNPSISQVKDNNNNNNNNNININKSLIDDDEDNNIIDISYCEDNSIIFNDIKLYKKLAKEDSDINNNIDSNNTENVILKSTNNKILDKNNNNNKNIEEIHNKYEMLSEDILIKETMLNSLKEENNDKNNNLIFKLEEELALIKKECDNVYIEATNNNNDKDLNKLSVNPNKNTFVSQTNKVLNNNKKDHKESLSNNNKDNENKEKNKEIIETINNNNICNDSIECTIIKILPCLHLSYNDYNICLDYNTKCYYLIKEGLPTGLSVLVSKSFVNEIKEGSDFMFLNNNNNNSESNDNSNSNSNSKTNSKVSSNKELKDFISNNFNYNALSNVNYNKHNHKYSSISNNNKHNIFQKITTKSIYNINSFSQLYFSFLYNIVDFNFKKYDLFWKYSSWGYFFSHLYNNVVKVENILNHDLSQEDNDSIIKTKINDFQNENIINNPNSNIYNLINNITEYSNDAYTLNKDNYNNIKPFCPILIPLVCDKNIYNTKINGKSITNKNKQIINDEIYKFKNLIINNILYNENSNSNNTNIIENSINVNDLKILTNIKCKNLFPFINIEIKNEETTNNNNNNNNNKNNIKEIKESKKKDKEKQSIIYESNINKESSIDYINGNNLSYCGLNSIYYSVNNKENTSIDLSKFRHLSFTSVKKQFFYEITGNLELLNHILYINKNINNKETNNANLLILSLSYNWLNNFNIINLTKASFEAKEYKLKINNLKEILESYIYNIKYSNSNIQLVSLRIVIQFWDILYFDLQSKIESFIRLFSNFKCNDEVVLSVDNCNLSNLSCMESIIQSSEFKLTYVVPLLFSKIISFYQPYLSNNFNSISNNIFYYSIYNKESNNLIIKQKHKSLALKHINCPLWYVLANNNKALDNITTLNKLLYNCNSGINYLNNDILLNKPNNKYNDSIYLDNIIDNYNTIESFGTSSNNSRILIDNILKKTSTEDLSYSSLNNYIMLDEENLKKLKDICINDKNNKLLLSNLEFMKDDIYGLDTLLIIRKSLIEFNIDSKTNTFNNVNNLSSVNFNKDNNSILTIDNINSENNLFYNLFNINNNQNSTNNNNNNKTTNNVTHQRLPKFNKDEYILYDLCVNNEINNNNKNWLSNCYSLLINFINDYLNNNNKINSYFNSIINLLNENYMSFYNYTLLILKYSNIILQNKLIPLSNDKKNNNEDYNKLNKIYNQCYKEINELMLSVFINNIDIVIKSTIIKDNVLTASKNNNNNNNNISIFLFLSNLIYSANNIFYIKNISISTLYLAQSKINEVNYLISKLLSNNFNNNNAISIINTEGISISSEKTYEYTVYKNDIVTIDEIVSFKNTNTKAIVIDISIIYPYGESLPKSEISIVSDNHDFKNTWCNSNNYYDFGTYFKIYLKNLNTDNLFTDANEFSSNNKNYFNYDVVNESINNDNTNNISTSNIKIKHTDLNLGNINSNLSIARKKLFLSGQEVKISCVINESGSSKVNLSVKPNETSKTKCKYHIVINCYGLNELDIDCNIDLNNSNNKNNNDNKFFYNWINLLSKINCTFNNLSTALVESTPLIKDEIMLLKCNNNSIYKNLDVLCLGNYKNNSIFKDLSKSNAFFNNNNNNNNMLKDLYKDIYSSYSKDSKNYLDIYSSLSFLKDNNKLETDNLNKYNLLKSLYNYKNDNSYIERAYKLITENSDNNKTYENSMILKNKAINKLKLNMIFKQIQMFPKFKQTKELWEIIELLITNIGNKIVNSININLEYNEDNKNNNKTLIDENITIEIINYILNKVVNYIIDKSVAAKEIYDMIKSYVYDFNNNILANKLKSIKIILINSLILKKKHIEYILKESENLKSNIKQKNTNKDANISNTKSKLDELKTKFISKKDNYKKKANVKKLSESIPINKKPTKVSTYTTSSKLENKNISNKVDSNAINKETLNKLSNYLNKISYNYELIDLEELFNLDSKNIIDYLNSNNYINNNLNLFNSNNCSILNLSLDENYSNCNYNSKDLENLTFLNIENDNFNKIKTQLSYQTLLNDLFTFIKQNTTINYTSKLTLPKVCKVLNICYNEENPKDSIELLSTQISTIVKIILDMNYKNNTNNCLYYISKDNSNLEGTTCLEEYNLYNVILAKILTNFIFLNDIDYSNINSSSNNQNIKDLIKSISMLASVNSNNLKKSLNDSDKQSDICNLILNSSLINSIIVYSLGDTTQISDILTNVYNSQSTRLNIRNIGYSLLYKNIEDINNNEISLKFNNIINKNYSFFRYLYVNKINLPTTDLIFIANNDFYNINNIEILTNYQMTRLISILKLYDKNYELNSNLIIDAQYYFIQFKLLVIEIDSSLRYLNSIECKNYKSNLNTDYIVEIIELSINYLFNIFELNTNTKFEFKSVNNNNNKNKFINISVSSKHVNEICDYIKMLLIKFTSFSTHKNNCFISEISVTCLFKLLTSLNKNNTNNNNMNCKINSQKSSILLDLINYITPYINLFKPSEMLLEGIEYLFKIILNSEIPESIIYACKISKKLLNYKSNTINNKTFDLLFKKLGNLITFKNNSNVLSAFNDSKIIKNSMLYRKGSDDYLDNNIDNTNELNLDKQIICNDNKDNNYVSNDNKENSINENKLNNKCVSKIKEIATIPEEEKLYYVVINMNSCEIDYKFLVNALYNWEEIYPTKLSIYKHFEEFKQVLSINSQLLTTSDKTSLLSSEENKTKSASTKKINEEIDNIFNKLKLNENPYIIASSYINNTAHKYKMYNYFNPLKSKESKVKKLETIVDEKILNNKKVADEAVKKIQSLLKNNNVNKKDEETKNKSSVDDKNKDNKQVSNNNDNNTEIRTNEIIEDEKLQISSLRKKLWKLKVEDSYYQRLKHHIKIAEMLGEIAISRGYVIIDTKMTKQMAEEFSTLVNLAFHNLLPTPACRLYNITDISTDNKENEISKITKDTQIPLFKEDILFPEFPKFEQYLAGCNNILKETTKPFVKTTIMHYKIYEKLNLTMKIFIEDANNIITNYSGLGSKGINDNIKYKIGNNYLNYLPGYKYSNLSLINFNEVEKGIYELAVRDNSSNNNTNNNNNNNYKKKDILTNSTGYIEKNSSLLVKNASNAKENKNKNVINTLNGRIIEEEYISGKSISLIIDQILDLIHYCFSYDSSSIVKIIEKNLRENYVKTNNLTQDNALNNEEKINNKILILGYLLYISGGYCSLRPGNKALFNNNPEELCVLINGGHKTGKSLTSVIFSNDKQTTTNYRKASINKNNLLFDKSKSNNTITSIIEKVNINKLQKYYGNNTILINQLDLNLLVESFLSAYGDIQNNPNCLYSKLIFHYLLKLINQKIAEGGIDLLVNDFQSLAKIKLSKKTSSSGAYSNYTNRDGSINNSSNSIKHTLKKTESNISNISINENINNTSISPNLLDKLVRILSIITNNAKCIYGDILYWETEINDAFERIYSQINAPECYIYSPSIDPIEKLKDYYSKYANNINSKENKTEINALITVNNSEKDYLGNNSDLLSIITLTQSNYVKYMPKLTDLSKLNNILRNIINFDRYFIPEIYSYSGGHYREDDYFASILQIRNFLAMNSVSDALRDLGTVFDNSILPLNMPLPVDNIEIKDITKEECYPSNYYIMRLNNKYIKNIGIKSLVKLGNLGIYEHPVEVLIVDKSLDRALVLYNDEEKAKVYSMWIPFEFLNFMEKQIKPPSNSYSLNDLLAEYVYLENKLTSFYAKDLLVKIREAQILQNKIDEFEQLMDSLLLASWKLFKKVEFNGPFRIFKNYVKISKDSESYKYVMQLLDKNIKHNKITNKLNTKSSLLPEQNQNINCLSLSQIISSINTQAAEFSSKQGINHSSFYNIEESLANLKLNKNVVDNLSSLPKITTNNLDNACTYAIDNIYNWCCNILNEVNFDKMFTKARINLSTEFNKKLNNNVKSEKQFKLGIFNSKLLALHELMPISKSNGNAVNKYSTIILSFEKNNCQLGANAKLSFYSDPYGENLIDEIYSIKNKKDKLNSIIFNYPKVWLNIKPGTNAFAGYNTFATDHEINLPCSIIYVPTEWSCLIWMLDFVSNQFFCYSKELSLEKFKSFGNLIKKLLTHSISLAFSPEVQQRFFHITNNIILKATQYMNLLCKIGDNYNTENNKDNKLSTIKHFNSLDFKSLSINKKFELLGIDEIILITLINIINNLYSPGESFSSAYIVDGVEVILAILSFIKEDFTFLDMYLRNNFDYSLPIWFEALIKLGQFLNYFQGNSCLEEEIVKELLDQLILKDQHYNICIIENINERIDYQLILDEVKSLIVNSGGRIADVDKDILIIPSYYNKSNKTTSVVILLNGFIVNNLVKLKVQENDDKEDEILENWNCTLCSNENDKDNTLCVFCDNPKPPQKKKKANKKISNLMKTENYIHSVNDLMENLKNSILDSKALNTIEEYELKEEYIDKTNENKDLKKKDSNNNKKVINNKEIKKEKVSSSKKNKVTNTDTNTTNDENNNKNKEQNVEKILIKYKIKVTKDCKVNVTIGKELGISFIDLSNDTNINKLNLLNTFFKQRLINSVSDKSNIINSINNENVNNEGYININKHQKIKNLLDKYKKEHIELGNSFIELSNVIDNEYSCILDNLKNVFKNKEKINKDYQEKNIKIDDIINEHKNNYDKNNEVVCKNNNNIIDNCSTNMTEYKNILSLDIVDINNDVNYIKIYQDIQELAGIDYTLQDTSIASLKNYIKENKGIEDVNYSSLTFVNNIIDKDSTLNPISLFEKIREIIDINFSSEKSIALVLPPSSINFCEEDSTNINHIDKAVLNLKYPEISKIPLAAIRFCWTIVKYFNSCLASALPFIKPPDLYASSCAIDIWEDNNDIYIPYPNTISSFLSLARGITFSVTKNSLLKDVVNYTEYDSQDVQIFTFKFERLNIANMIQLNDNQNQENINDNSTVNNNTNSNVQPFINEDKNKTKDLNNEESIFLQAFEQGFTVDPAFFRISKSPGDPHVSFKVEFKGEHVQGIGGPYRQFFSDISAELQPLNTLTNNIKCLKLLIPSVNNKFKRGEFKDKFILNPSYVGNTAYNHYEFLGMLMGICLRTGTHLTLDLCTLVWKKIVSIIIYKIFKLILK